MNISALSFSAPGSIQTGLELAVMSKALDTAEVTGDAISRSICYWPGTTHRLAGIGDGF